MNLFQWLKPKSSVRVRIAPSPTGFLHIGTARTALFNWLFAKHSGGKFILRIEDTDLERSDLKYEKDIIESLKWLGLEWDEGPVAFSKENAELPITNHQLPKKYIGNYGPYRQSEKLAIYEKYLTKLLKNGNAYYCECTKEELEQERQAQLKRGEAPKYSGKCRNKNVLAEKAQLIRFKIPAETVVFNDLIRGKISFDTALFGDLAIAKNLRAPLYNFAVVVDDWDMKISHVIRGEDHIANTPKQILIQRALGFKTPQYAHLPLILDSDRSKLSKRNAATSVQEYRKDGYLPEALINFIALLGWHSQDDREILNREELIKEFNLARVQKSGAVFNIEKLDWLNAQYIKKADIKELRAALKYIFGEEILNFPFTDKLIELSRKRLLKLSEFKDINDFFFQLPDYPAELLIWKSASKEKTQENLRTVQEMIRGLLKHEFNLKNIEAFIMPFANTEGRGEVLWPLRIALSGKEKSPGPFEIIDVLGKEETLKRINIALEKLKH
jgi:nondiscriminating glutamyl-tRNA synthetase